MTSNAEITFNGDEPRPRTVPLKEMRGKTAEKYSLSYKRPSAIGDVDLGTDAIGAPVVLWEFPKFLLTWKIGTYLGKKLPPESMVAPAVSL